MFRVKKLFSILLFIITFYGGKDNLYASDTTNFKSFINFEGETLSGERIKLSDHAGKVIVLNFWFIGCAPCMGEIPDINEIYRFYKDSNVIVLSLATNSREQLIKFNEGKKYRPIEKIEYPILPDCQKIANDYGITGYPTTIIIDKKGFIRKSTGATLQSLQNYITFYGDKGLSKETKKIIKTNEHEEPVKTSEILKTYINSYLRE
jgi:thiol-disulfide isomerase/thioredoxin